MTDNRTTDELRRLLDERGVKYESLTEEVTRVFFPDHLITYCEIDGGIRAAIDFPTPDIAVVPLTPEQAIAATLWKGTLTAEQVREAIERHSIETLGCRRQFRERDWQAIADELNATLGSGTCELAYGEDDEGYDGWYCQSCGRWFDAVWRDGRLVEPTRCGCCGKAVVE